MPELEAMTRDVVAEQFAKLGGSLEPSEAAEPAEDASGEPEPASAAEPERAAAPGGRDEKGRFAKGGGKEPAAQGKAGVDGAADPDAAAGQGAAADAGAQAAAAASALPKLNPPQDWRAEARAEFAKLPRVVQEEALRLHVETKKGLQDLAEARKEAGSWKEATSPYGHVFGGQPAQQVVGNLLRTFAALQGGHPQQRAAIVADLVRSYVGTDDQALRLLAAAIDGSGPAQQIAQPQAMNPEQIRQLARQEWENAQREQGTQVAVRVWQEFEKTADLLNEQGVRADLAELAGKWTRENPGQAPTKEVFQRLYDRACQLNEGAAKIVNQRKEAEAAGKANASTQARTAAAVGIKNEPAVAGSTSEPADTVKEEVTRQYARLSNKRR